MPVPASTTSDSALARALSTASAICNWASRGAKPSSASANGPSAPSRRALVSRLMRGYQSPSGFTTLHARACASADLEPS